MRRPKVFCITKGIEVPQQLAWLREMGCELGQGYLVSIPKTSDEVTRLLQQVYR